VHFISRTATENARINTGLSHHPRGSVAREVDYELIITTTESSPLCCLLRRPNYRPICILSSWNTNGQLFGRCQITLNGMCVLLHWINTQYC